jgi:hypothetical protein
MSFGFIARAYEVFRGISVEKRYSHGISQLVLVLAASAGAVV